MKSTKKKEEKKNIARRKINKCMAKQLLYAVAAIYSIIEKCQKFI